MLPLSYWDCGVDGSLAVPRKIDVTCRDFDEKVIGRNIILWTLLLDESAVEPSRLWDIYYHLYVDEAAVDVVLKHLQKLLPLLESPKSWRAGLYGNSIKFCDGQSLDDVRRVCAKIVHDAERCSTEAYAANFKEWLEQTKHARNLIRVKGPLATGMRSAAPLTLKSFADMIAAFETYCQHGTVTPSSTKDLLPNPMFASFVSENGILHYGTDPTLGFHLATAFAPLSENSPLRLPDGQTDFRSAMAAKGQFAEWVAAFREIAHQRFKMRFMIADVFACSHTLQHVAASGKLSANWYRRQWELRALELDADEYGTGRGGAPTAFDVVDTSNLADHVGSLNLIIATSVLLKSQPWATLYTDILLKGGSSQQAAFEKMLCGKPAIVSLLTGVSPVQYWTNAKCESHVSGMLMPMMSSSSEGTQIRETQLHSRLAWKRDDWFSGQPDNRAAIHVETSAMARILFQVYSNMFASENLQISADILSRSATYAHFHRGTFSSFLKLVKCRVKTDWEEACSQLLGLIGQDRSLSLSSFHLQELGIQMHLQGVSTMPWILGDATTSRKAGPFRHWKDIPSVVAVTLVVPRPAIERLYSDSPVDKLSGPTLEGSLRAANGDANWWHNLYSDVQIVFGTVREPPENETTPIVIEQDDSGWDGSSPLIATFVVPAKALQVDPVNAMVGIQVSPSAQAVMLYAETLGLNMCLFECKISASTVFVSSFMPGQSGHPVVCGGAQPFKDAVEGPNAGSHQKLMVEVPASESHFSSMMSHVDILSKKGRKLLQDKAPIEFRQQDPFTIDVVFGKKALVQSLRFPVPITQKGIRSRVARKSGYIEVMAPMASSKDTEILADFIFPTRLNKAGVPSALNISHMNLDALPILNSQDKSNMQWLVMFAFLEFSAREKKIREAGSADNGICQNTRINLKEALLTMFLLASGLQGDQTGNFAIHHPQRGGIQMLILVSAIRLDADNSSVALDAAVLSSTMSQFVSEHGDTVLWRMSNHNFQYINVNDAELILWKRLLPAMAERCRTYEHRSTCEYKRPRATVPLSIEPGEQILCSCGNGKLPPKFVSLPKWNIAAQYATRIAISPTFSVPEVEDVVDIDAMVRGSALMAAGNNCLWCKGESAQDGSALKRCVRCQTAKYCSAECQKRDWEKHRTECQQVKG